MAVALLACLAPRSCPVSTLHLEPRSSGGEFRSLLPPKRMSLFLLIFSVFPSLLNGNLLCRHAIPPTSLLDTSISAVWLFPAGKGAGYSSTWTLSIHDQWRGPALYTKLSRRAGLFYSQPCGFKQIAQTGELKQILSYRSKTWRENR